ncbi:MAG: hypothetical protein AAB734_02470 [Patescibacteria group bacterium]
MLGDIQFKTEQRALEKQEDCLRFMKRGLAVISDRCLLMELEIAAGLSPTIDIDRYRADLQSALLKRTEQLYDVKTISPVFTRAKIDLVEYGLQPGS